jgi:hypothetical protein
MADTLQLGCGIVKKVKDESKYETWYFFALKEGNDIFLAYRVREYGG